MRLLRFPFPVFLGLRLQYLCSPDGMPVIWALANPKRIQICKFAKKLA